MNKFSEIFYDKILFVLKWLCFFFTLTLFLSTLIFSSYIEGTQVLKVVFCIDNIFISILGCSFFVFFIKWILKWIKGNPIVRSRRLLIFTLIYYIVGGATLILFARSTPTADSLVVYWIADECAVNYFGAIHPTASYLSYYPHQIGLIAYLEIVLRFWKLLQIDLIGFHILKILNVLWVCIMIIAQYKLLELFFRNYQINAIYLLLTIFNLPLMIYVSFIYGDIPSISLFSCGFFSFLKMLECIDNKKHYKRITLYIVLSCAFFTACVALRKNAIILMIAVIGVTVFEYIRRKKIVIISVLIVYVIITIFTLPIIELIYECRAGNELSSGVPALCFVAMGMQESSSAAGWYNGFNFDTYESVGLDTDLANEVSREFIKERINFFRDNPKEAMLFYSSKYLSQWCHGTYGVLQSTVQNMGGRTMFFKQLYDGKYDFIFIPFCNLMQLIVYLGTFIFSMKKTFSDKKKCEISVNEDVKLQKYPLYACLIGVFGGFLFHMIWEAGARYTFTYFLLLYPYAAYGINVLIVYLNNFKDKQSTEMNIQVEQ